MDINDKDYQVNVSLDAKIDSYLMEYERNAVVGAPKLPGSQPPPTLASQGQLQATGKMPSNPQIQVSSLVGKKIVEFKDLPVKKKSLIQENVSATIQSVLPIQPKKINPIEQLTITVQASATNDDGWKKDKINTLPVKVKNISENKVLVEAEGDAPTTDAPGSDPGEDSSSTTTDDSNDGGETPSTEPTLPDKPKINLSSFTRDCARLIEGYEYILNPKQVVYNRCKAFIKVNYGEQVAQAFSQLLSVQYKIDIREPNDSIERVPVTRQPFTVGSTGEGSIGGGGGT